MQGLGSHNLTVQIDVFPACQNLCQIAPSDTSSRKVKKEEEKGKALDFRGLTG